MVLQKTPHHKTTITSKENFNKFLYGFVSIGRVIQARVWSFTLDIVTTSDKVSCSRNPLYNK